MVNLEIKDLTKVYNKKTVLDNISFEVKDGEFLSILGPSGCGKTTLLKILIGIENPTSGRILKKEKDITKLDSSKRGMGIVFQNYALFPNMTVLDNVMYALNLKLKNKEEAKKEALKMIKVVNMEEHIKKYPHELSGGQQQRVAIARALVSEAPVILADEPTGNLDNDTAGEIIEILKKLAKERNKCVIVVTHSREVANSADIILELSGKKLKKISQIN